MSNTASLELCRELYELSGWDDLWNWWYINPDGSEGVVNVHMDGKIAPAYDLGFLLRKLPPFQMNKMKPGAQPGFDYSKYEWYMVRINGGSSKKPVSELNKLRIEDDSPENAACRLAIELFKKGVLSR